MSDSCDATLGAPGPWLEEILADFDSEIRERGVRLRLDLDPAFLIERDGAVDSALRELLRFILATTPDGCEIYLGSARSTASVSRLGAGALRARWQVVGDRAASPDSDATPIHPVVGDAERHVGSSQARAVHAKFARTRWAFSLDALAADQEIHALATVD